MNGFIYAQCQTMKNNIGKISADEYGGLELTAEAARFYTSGRARFTPPGGHILQ